MDLTALQNAGVITLAFLTLVITLLAVPDPLPRRDDMRKAILLFFCVCVHRFVAINVNLNTRLFRLTDRAWNELDPKVTHKGPYR